MKKISIVSIALFAAGGLFLIGWNFGERSVTKPSGKFINALMFGNAYSQVLNDELLVELIDSNRTEDVKKFIQLRINGNILAMNSLIETTNSEFSTSILKILLQMDESTQSQYGTKKQRASKILSRVAKYRTEHPWKYSGTMTATNDPEVEAKLADILKQASESQK